MEFRLLSEMKMLPRFLQVSTVPHPHVVALLIRGLTIRFLFKEKPMHARTGGYPTSARSTSRGGWLETPRLVSNPINTVTVVADAVAISNGRRVGA